MLTHISQINDVADDAAYSRPNGHNGGTALSPNSEPMTLRERHDLACGRRRSIYGCSSKRFKPDKSARITSSARADAFSARPVRFGPRAEVIRLAPSDLVAPPGTGLELRLLWPQRHGPPGSRPDRGAVQLGAGLGNAVLPQDPTAVTVPVGRQRVNPEVSVLAAAAAPAPAPALLQDQAPVIVIVRRPVVHAGGGRSAAIGIQNAQPQLVIVPLGAGAGPVPFEGIGVACPAGLRLATQANVEGELESVRVGADTADGYGNLLTADQHNLWGTDAGITASERIQAGRRCRTGSGGGGCGIDSRKLMQSD
jgi:hypothetical protein